MNGGETPAKHRGLMPPWKPGQSGNPAGRPKGARSKLGEAFLEALAEDFSEHGVKAIKDSREKDPAAYVRTISGLLPKILAGDADAPLNVNLSALDASELDQLERLARKLAVAGADQDGDREAED